MLVAAFTSYFVGSLIQQQRLPPEVSTLIYRPLAMFVRVLMIASILAGLINGTAILFPPQEGVYFFAILGPLVAGATIFLRIVFVRPAA